MYAYFSWNTNSTCVFWERDQENERERESQSWLTCNKNFKMHFWLYQICHCHKAHHPPPRLYVYIVYARKTFVSSFPVLPCTHVWAHTLKYIQPTQRWFENLVYWAWNPARSCMATLPCLFCLPLHHFSSPIRFEMVQNFFSDSQTFDLFFFLSIFALHSGPYSTRSIYRHLVYSSTSFGEMKKERERERCICANTYVALDLFVPMYAALFPVITIE